MELNKRIRCGSNKRVLKTEFEQWNFTRAQLLFALMEEFLCNIYPNNNYSVFCGSFLCTIRLWQQMNKNCNISESCSSLYTVEVCWHFIEKRVNLFSLLIKLT